MQRIDGPTASAVLPAPRPVGAGPSAPGYFQNGDPLTGTPPTTLDVDWANMVQEEILGPIVASGLEPSKTDHGQLNAAIDRKIAAIVAPDGGASSLVANGGYKVDADGLKRCWGSVYIGANGSAAVNIPVQHTDFLIPGGLASSIAQDEQSVGVASVDLSGFTIRNRNPMAITFYWQTVGR